MGLNTLVALKIKSLKDNIIGKELQITDNFYKLKGEYSHNDNFFHFTNYKAFEGVNDAKTNNLSNIILTQKGLGSDILEQNKYLQKKLFALDSITTSLSFGGNKTSNASFISVNPASGEIKITSSPRGNSILVFQIDSISNNECYISYIHNAKKYYLCTNGVEGKLSFKALNSDEKAQIFVYHVYDNVLNLFAVLQDELYSLVFANGEELRLEKDEDFIEHYETNYYRNIYLRNQIDIDFPLDATWVSYEHKNDINYINNEKSSFSLENQFIIHHEYNTDSSANFIPLKNNLTYKNEVSNGNSLVYSEKEYNDVVKPDFRNYTSLSTGINQETGSDTITLTFMFNDQSFKIEEGEDLYFTIPETKKTFQSKFLFPYEQINLNDAPFIRNGAFGSNSPAFSDKIKYYGSSEIKNEDSKEVVTRYLCSWLYNNEDTNETIWLDRYYNPLAVSSDEAENKPCNLIDLYLDTVDNETIYDKRSDITLCSGGKYKYSRISQDSISNFYYSLSKYACREMISNNGASSLTSSLISLNANNWYKLSNEDIKFENAIHFNADFFITPEKQMGIQLFGSDYRHGFNIQNRKNLMPFYHFADETTVYLLNNSHKICKKLNVAEKYNDKIRAIASDVAFEVVYIITQNGILILNYDLSTVFYDRNENISGAEILNEIDFKDKTLSVYNSDLYIPHENRVIKIDYLENYKNNKRGENLNLVSVQYANNYKVLRQEANKALKSLYIHSDGTIYVSDAQIIKIAPDKNTIFSILKSDNELTPYEVSAYRINDESTSENAYFRSKKSIDNISISPSDEMILIRGFQGNETDKRRLEIYDKARNRIYTHTLKQYSKILYTNYCNYIDINGVEHSGFIVSASRNGSIEIIFYNLETQKVTTYSTLLKESSVNVISVTNDNNTLKFVNENKLYFNLFQRSKLIQSAEWDLSEVQTGWYNIDVAIDANKSTMVIRINDKILLENKSLIGIQNINQFNLFDGTYFIGAVSKNHGLSLSELLYNGLKDPYSVKNIKIRNLTFYNKVLTPAERHASQLYFKKINPLILTIPCGIRSASEEIIRYFKYNRPGNISNKIKINIAGLAGIESERDRKRLMSYLLDAVKESGDCLTNIEEIEFIKTEE